MLFPDIKVSHRLLSKVAMALSPTRLSHRKWHALKMNTRCARQSLLQNYPPYSGIVGSTCVREYSALANWGVARQPLESMGMLLPIVVCTLMS